MYQYRDSSHKDSSPLLISRILRTFRGSAHTLDVTGGAYRSLFQQRTQPRIYYVLCHNPSFRTHPNINLDQRSPFDENTMTSADIRPRFGHGH